MDRHLTPDHLEQLAKHFDAEPRNRLMQNAVSTTPVNAVALDRSVLTSIDHSMSNLLDDWSATNQKHSGRCWLFAGLNLLRAGAARRMNVKEFEFSQNHVLFWDKLEKANHWLESIIETADRDVDDRTVAHLLANPVEDGGQWNMFVALVVKHGLVPQYAMPETQSSSATSAMNAQLATTLRQGARDLRAVAADGADAESLRRAKAEVVETVHRLLSIHLGTPPERFLWQWKDKDRSFHRGGWMTPQEFATEYVGLDLADHVCLVHDPRAANPKGRTYTVDRLGNVVGAAPVVYLNTDIDTMKRLAIDSITAGTPVWFGCDTEPMSNAEHGVWDAALHDYDSVYGRTTSLSKEDRLLHHESLMTHAMLFTGVDLVDGVPRRWRVENSWGTDKADKGFWTMNDSWFAEYVFEIAVPKSALTEDLRAALDAEPIVLPAWDPMGALAR